MLGIARTNADRTMSALPNRRRPGTDLTRTVAGTEDTVRPLEQHHVYRANITPNALPEPCNELAECPGSGQMSSICLLLVF
jgi:hypothetical protein